MQVIEPIVKHTAGLVSITGRTCRTHIILYVMPTFMLRNNVVNGGRIFV